MVPEPVAANATSFESVMVPFAMSAVCTARAPMAPSCASHLAISMGRQLGLDTHRTQSGQGTDDHCSEGASI